MDFFSLKSIRLPVPRLLSDTVMKYLSLKKDSTQLSNFISDLLSNLQNELHDNNPEIRANAVQQLIFLNSVGYDTTWADFAVLDVMSLDNFSCKRIAYTEASQSWNPHSDVVLMATNRIQKDLNSNNPLYTSVVLSSITPFLSPQLSQDIASDIILQLNSSKAKVRQQAAVTFYHVCLKYPDALRAGFASLKSRLNDEDNSVVFSVLTVMVELCQINPRNFIGFIPKIFKMLNNCSSDWINLRLLTLLRILSTVEPRLPKKLIQPLTIVLETTPSVFVMYECVRSIIEIPISNQNLLAAATYRLQSFLNVPDANLRFLCLSLFIKLMKIQPRLVSQHRDLISMCLDSDNELERMMALDLMSNLVTPKTIDTIVGKMFHYFQESTFVPFRDGMIEKVVEMCTRGGDYEMIQDFEWYISVLMDFVENGNFSESSGTLLAQQFTELAYRVPDIRLKLVDEMGLILDKRSCTPLLLSACHIISEFAVDSKMFSKLLQPIIVDCDDRVQDACLTTSFLIYLKCTTEEELDEIESMFDLKLPLFLQSRYIEIQETAASLIELVSTCKKIRVNGHFQEFKKSFETCRRIENESEVESEAEDKISEVIEIPDELNEPLTIFDDNDEELDVLYPYIRRKKHHKRHGRKQDKNKKSADDEDNRSSHHHHRKSPKNQYENIFGDEDEEVLNNDDDYDNDKSSEINKEQQKGDAFVERMIKRRQSRRRKASVKKPEDYPVTGPIPYSRFQQIGKNSAISIGAVDFIPIQKKLEIVLEIKNLSQSSIPSIDFSVIESQNLHKISAESLLSPIEGCNVTQNDDSQKVAQQTAGVIQHSIVVSVDDTLIPQMMKFYVLPVAGEALEARLRIFPSFFLVQADPALFELASAKTVKKEVTSFDVPKGKKPREVLQDAANILQANVVDKPNFNNQENGDVTNLSTENNSKVDHENEEVDNSNLNKKEEGDVTNLPIENKREVNKEVDSDDKSKILISKTSTGEYVITKITYVDNGKVSIEINSPIEKLSKTLIKEVELKLKAPQTK